MSVSLSLVFLSSAIFVNLHLTLPWYTPHSSTQRGTFQACVSTYDPTEASRHRSGQEELAVSRCDSFAPLIIMDNLLALSV